MPDFYSECSTKDYLEKFSNIDLVANSMKNEMAFRNFIISKTHKIYKFRDSEILWSEQKKSRHTDSSNKSPFWANYWYDTCENCECTTENEKRLQVDAIFFIMNKNSRILGIHIKFLHNSQKFTLGQAEAYRPRAECYRDQRRERATLLDHDDFLTVLIHGSGTDLEFARKHFDRVISHHDLEKQIEGYHAV